MLKDRRLKRWKHLSKAIKKKPKTNPNPIPNKPLIKFLPEGKARV